MENILTSQAINLALAGDWKEASKVNKQLLAENPNDLDALNRLARCYSELGNVSLAVSTSQKVLKIDPENSIAQKCLYKWKKITHKKFAQKELKTESFLEESGKTKIVRLLNPGDGNIFANLNSGDEVNLHAYAHKVSVTSMDGKYIGRLPDDVAARLRNLLKQGAKYQTLIKSVDSKNVSIFIKELENKTGVTSFPPEKMDYVTFAPPELVHRDLPEIANAEEIQE
jgi:tetratricopeptide (TPR) repeat protein